MTIKGVVHDETERALELLCVAVSVLMKEHATLAIVSPKGAGGYSELAAELQLACRDIATLVDAMGVLARRFPG